MKSKFAVICALIVAAPVFAGDYYDLVNSPVPQKFIHGACFSPEGTKCGTQVTDTQPLVVNGQSQFNGDAGVGGKLEVAGGITQGGVAHAIVQHGVVTLASGVGDAGFGAAFASAPDCACSLTALDAGEIVRCNAAAGFVNAGSNNAGSTSKVSFVCAQ